MARKAPGRSGPVIRSPWSGDGWPSDWRASRLRGKGRAKSPRPGARTGPVRGKRK